MGAFRAIQAGNRMFGKDKKNQRDLFESERNFRLLVGGVTDYALYMLDPSGIVTSWNIGAQRIYREAAAIGAALARESVCLVCPA